MRDLDELEIEDPTQPFTRARIDSLRRRADEEWVEVSGRRFRVSLEALSHIGGNGTPEGMIGSADTAFVHGEIGGEPPELDEAVEWLTAARRSRRKIGLALAVASVLGLVAWAWPTSEQTGESVQPIIRVESVPVRPVEADFVVVSPSTSTTPEVDGNRESSPRPTSTRDKSRLRDRGDKQEAGCELRRRRARQALRDGDWVRLEKLARQSSCWPRACEAAGLQMKALLELDRYRECVRIGKTCKSEETTKWLNICERAPR